MFFIDMQKRFQSEMTKFLRTDLGVKIPMTGSNWARTTSLLRALQEMDFLEAHAYLDHPWENMKRFTNRTSTSERWHIWSHFCFNRLVGKPYMAMEWDQPWPNEWRAELPLQVAAVAALQDVDGIAGYTYRHSLGKESLIEAPFEMALDPARFGLLPHAALLYRRDVEPAGKTVEITHVENAAATVGAPAQWDHLHALSATPEQHRVQVAFGEGRQGEVRIDAHQSEETVLPDQWVIPETAPSVRSDTGQLWRSWDAGRGTIDTPGTKAVYGRHGVTGHYDLQDLTINMETDFGTVAISSLTNDPIRSSNLMLITTVGRVENTDQAYNLTRTQLVDEGKAPTVMEPIKATIILKSTQKGPFLLWKLNPDGSKSAGPSVTHNGDSLQVTLGLPGQASLHYLLELK